MTPPRGSQAQYYILPKDDPTGAVNILRAAGGLDPLAASDDPEKANLRSICPPGET